MSYADDQHAILEARQKIKSNDDLYVMSTKKEAEKQKRNKKLIFIKTKWLLYDELRAKSDTLTDLNALLYDEKLKDEIIDNALLKLGELYQNFKDETLEDVNYYLLEIYNTTATRIITIKTKEKKELERIEKERQRKENYQRMEKLYNIMQQAPIEWEKHVKEKMKKNPFYKMYIDSPRYNMDKQKFINEYIEKKKKELL